MTEEPEKIEPAMPEEPEKIEQINVSKLKSGLYIVHLTQKSWNSWASARFLIVN